MIGLGRRKGREFREQPGIEILPVVSASTVAAVDDGDGQPCIIGTNKTRKGEVQNFRAAYRVSCKGGHGISRNHLPH